MVMFNVLIGLGVASGVLAATFFLKKKRWFGMTLAAVIVGVGATSLSQHWLYPQYVTWRFEKALLQQPLFVLIAKTHPEQYQTYLKHAKSHLSEKEGLSHISQYSAELVNTIFTEHLKQTPDEQVVLFLRATLDLYTHLYPLSPEAIVVFEKGENPENLNMNALLDDKTFQTLLSRLLDTKRYAIEAGINTPSNTPTKTQAKPLLTAMLSTLEEEGAPKTSQDEAKKILRFYTLLLDSGKEKAGIVMRYMAAQQS